MRTAPVLRAPVLRAAVLSVALAGALLLGGVAASAAASVGPVPPAVRAYVTGGGLVEQLAEEQLAEAQLDGAAEPGPISRVFRWTDARLAGERAGKPVRMANEWAVPVTIGGQPAGVALVEMNLDTGQPQLLELLSDPAAATALAAVPDDAELVRDAGSGAWFALVGDTATPLAAGDSGVTGPTHVDELELVAEQPAAELAPDDADAGPGLGAGLAAASVVVALATTLVVVRRAETV